MTIPPRGATRGTSQTVFQSFIGQSLDADDVDVFLSADFQVCIGYFTALIVGFVIIAMCLTGGLH